MDSDSDSGGVAAVLQPQREGQYSRQEQLQHRLQSARARLIQSSKDVATLASHEKYKRLQAQRRMDRALTHTVESQHRILNADQHEPPAGLSPTDFARHFEARQLDPSLVTSIERDVIVHILSAPTIDDVVLISNAWLREQHSDSYSDEDVALFIIDESPRHAWSIQHDGTTRFSVERNVQIQSWTPGFLRSRSPTSISEGISRAVSIVGAAVKKRLMAIPCVAYDGTLMAYLQVDSRLLSPGKQAIEADVLLAAQVLGAKLQNMVMMHTSLPELHRLQCHELLTEFRPTERRLVTLSVIQNLASNALHAVYGSEWSVHIVFGFGAIGTDSGRLDSQFPFHLAPGQDAPRALALPEPALNILHKTMLPGRFASDIEQQVLVSALSVKNSAVVDTAALFAVYSEQFEACAILCAFRKASLFGSDFVPSIGHNERTPEDDSLLHMIWTELQACFDFYCENVQECKLECANSVTDNIFNVRNSTRSAAAWDWTAVQYRLSRLAGLYGEAPELMVVNSKLEGDGGALFGTDVGPLRNIAVQPSDYETLKADGWISTAALASRNNHDHSSPFDLALLFVAEVSTTSSVVLAVPGHSYCLLDRHAQLVAVPYPAPQFPVLGSANLLEPLRVSRLPGILRLMIQNQQAHEMQAQRQAACVQRLLSRSAEQRHRHENIRNAFKMWRERTLMQLASETINRSNIVLAGVHQLNSDDLLTPHGALVTTSWINLTRQLFGPMANVDCSVSCCEVQQQFETVTITRRDEGPSRAVITCVVQLPKDQHLETLVQVTVTPMLDHQLVVFESIARIYQQLVLQVSPVNIALSDKLRQCLRVTLEDVAANEPFVNVVSRHLVEFHQALGIERLEIRCGDRVIVAPADEDQHDLEDLTVEGRHRSRMYSVIEPDAVSQANTGCSLTGLDSQWDIVKEGRMQAFQAMLLCVHEISAIFQAANTRNQRDLDFHRLCQVRLEQQVSQHETAIAAAGYVVDVMRHCIDVYSPYIALPSTDAVTIPELADALGVEECFVGAKTDVDPGGSNFNEDATIVLGCGNDNDEVTLRLVGNLPLHLDDEIFRRGLGHIAKLTLYCRESKSVIADLRKILREHTSLKGIVLKSSETASDLQRSFSHLQVDLARALKTIEKQRSDLKAGNELNTQLQAQMLGQEQRAVEDAESLRRSDWLNVMMVKMERADTLLDLQHVIADGLSTHYEVSQCHIIVSTPDLADSLLHDRQSHHRQHQERHLHRHDQIAKECWEHGEPVLKHGSRESVLAFPIVSNSANAVCVTRACLVLTRCDQIFDVADLKLLGSLQPVLLAAVTRCTLLESWERNRSAEAAWLHCQAAMQAVCSDDQQLFTKVFTENKPVSDAFSAFVHHLLQRTQMTAIFQHCTFGLHSTSESNALDEHDIHNTTQHTVTVDGKLLGTATMQQLAGDSRMLQLVRGRIFSTICQLFGLALKHVKTVYEATGTSERASGCVNILQQRVTTFEQVIERELRLRTKLRDCQLNVAHVADTTDAKTAEHSLEVVLRQLSGFEFGSAAAIFVVDDFATDIQLEVVAVFTSSTPGAEIDSVFHTHVELAEAEREALNGVKPVLVSTRASWFWRWCQGKAVACRADPNMILMVPVSVRGITRRLLLCVANDSNAWSDHDCFVIQQLGQQLLWSLQMRDGVIQARRATQDAQATSMARLSAEAQFEECAALLHAYSTGIASLAQWDASVRQSEDKNAGTADLRTLANMLTAACGLPENSVRLEQFHIGPKMPENSTHTAPAKPFASPEAVRVSVTGRHNNRLTAAISGVSEHDIKQISAMLTNVMQLAVSTLTDQSRLQMVHEQLASYQKRLVQNHDAIEHYFGLLQRAQAVCDITAQVVAQLPKMHGEMMDYRAMNERLQQELLQSVSQHAATSTLSSSLLHAPDSFEKRMMRLCYTRHKPVFVTYSMEANSTARVDDPFAHQLVHDLPNLLVVETPFRANASNDNSLFLCVGVELPLCQVDDGNSSETLLLLFRLPHSAALSCGTFAEAEATTTVLQTVANGLQNAQHFIQFVVSKHEQMGCERAKSRSHILSFAERARQRQCKLVLRTSWSRWVLFISRKKAQAATRQLISSSEAVHELERQSSLQQICSSVTSQAARGLDACLKKLRAKWNSRFGEQCKLQRAGIIVPCTLGEDVNIRALWDNEFEGQVQQQLATDGSSFAIEGWAPIEDANVMRGIRQLESTKAKSLEMAWTESSILLLTRSSATAVGVTFIFEFQPVAATHGYLPPWVPDACHWLSRILEPLCHLETNLVLLRNMAVGAQESEQSQLATREALRYSHALLHELAASLNVTDISLQCDMHNYIRAAVIASLQLILHARDINIAIGEGQEEKKASFVRCQAHGNNGELASSTPELADYYKFEASQPVKPTGLTISVSACIPNAVFSRMEDATAVLGALLSMASGLISMASVTTIVQSQLSQAMSIASGFEREISILAHDRRELQTQTSDLAAQELYQRRLSHVFQVVVDKPTEVMELGDWFQNLSENVATLVQKQGFQMSFIPLEPIASNEPLEAHWLPSPPLPHTARSQLVDQLVASAISELEPKETTFKAASGDVWWFCVEPICNLDQHCVGAVGIACACDPAALPSSTQPLLLSEVSLCKELARSIGTAPLWQFETQRRVLAEIASKFFSIAMEPQRFGSLHDAVEHLLPSTVRHEFGLDSVKLVTARDPSPVTWDHAGVWLPCSEARAKFAQEPELAANLPPHGFVFMMPIHDIAFDGITPPQVCAVHTIIQVVLAPPRHATKVSARLLQAKEMLTLMASTLQLLHNHGRLCNDVTILATSLDSGSFIEQVRSVFGRVVDGYIGSKVQTRLDFDAVARPQHQARKQLCAFAHEALQEQIRKVAECIAPAAASSLHREIELQLVILPSFQPFEKASALTAPDEVIQLTAREVKFVSWDQLNSEVKACIVGTLLQDDLPAPGRTSTCMPIATNQELWGVLQLPRRLERESLLGRQSVSQFATLIASFSMALHILPAQIEPIIHSLRDELQHSVHTEKLLQVQLGETTQAMTELNRLLGMLRELTPSVSAHVLGANQSLADRDGSQHVLQKLARTRRNCWDEAAASLLQLLDSMLPPGTGISLQLLRQKKRRRLLVACNGVNIHWPNLQRTGGTLKWDPHATSILADAMQFCQPFHVHQATQHPSYHRHVDGEIDGGTNLFVVPLMNARESDCFGTITIARNNRNGITPQEQRAVEVVGAIAALTLSWCALVGDVRRDINQLCGKVENLEQSVANRALQSRLLPPPGEDVDERQGNFEEGLYEELSAIPTHLEPLFSSDDAKQGECYSENKHNSHQLPKTPSKTALSMAIGRFLD